MEQRSYTERCLVGRSSGPPMLPGLSNNHKRLVQTDDTLLILNETSHDVRVVRIGGDHEAPELKRWLGDSIGWREGDVLVVETTNFVDRPAYANGSGEMLVFEEFRMQDPDSLVYSFTVEDLSLWSSHYTGEYEWARSNGRVYEHVCHEGNYPLDGIMRGALERIYRGEDIGGVPNPTRCPLRSPYFSSSATRRSSSRSTCAACQAICSSCSPSRWRCCTSLSSIAFTL